MQFRHLPHFGRRHPAHSLHLRRLVLFLRSNGAHVEVVVSFSVPMFERWYSSLRHVDFRVIFLRYEWVIWEWHDRNVKKMWHSLQRSRTPRTRRTYPLLILLCWHEFELLVRGFQWCRIDTVYAISMIRVTTSTSLTGYGVGDRRYRKTTELTFVTFVRHDLFLVDVEIVLFDHTEQSICNSTQRRGFHDWIFHTTCFLSWSKGKFSMICIFLNVRQSINVFELFCDEIVECTCCVRARSAS